MPNRDFIAWLNRGAKSSSPSIADPLSFVNPSRDKKFNKRKKTNEGGQFDWRSTMVKDLPKSFGSNQEKKFDSLAKQSGIPESELAGLKLS